MSLLSDIPALNALMPRWPDYFVIDFEPAMIPMIKPRDTDQTFFDHIPDFKTILAGYKEIGHAYYFCHQGKPICMFGVVPLWPGVGETWLITDVSMSDHARPFHYTARIMLARFMSELQLVRLQISVHAQNVRGYKWAQSVKFNDEGLMKNFGPDGNDFYMMARI